jgi:hypothetical protein
MAWSSQADDEFAEFEYRPFQEAATDDPVLALPRPYLRLVLTGPNGRPEPVRGIVDTGADLCLLPAAYLDLLGYEAHDVIDVPMEQAGGSATLRLAETPCRAHVEGLEEIRFDVQPGFVAGMWALWGRMDFMEQFVVCVNESSRVFALRPA